LEALVRVELEDSEGRFPGVLHLVLVGDRGETPFRRRYYIERGDTGLEVVFSHALPLRRALEERELLERWRAGERLELRWEGEQPEGPPFTISEVEAGNMTMWPLFRLR
jgi:hypothetical protein